MPHATLENLGITADRIRHYDQRIPRYTSYPTAPFWKPEFGSSAWENHLKFHAGSDQDLALYVHIPFCEKHCLFCACNTIITPRREVAADYLGYLDREIDLAAEFYRPKGRVAQLHFGGGTPNYLSNEQLEKLVGHLRNAFDFDPDAELSIEVDPRVASPEDMHFYFKRIGFRRVSFGTQDFSEETQFAIGREQTRDITFANVAAAREAGFQSVNIDLIYGLPKQTEETWRSTLDDVISLRPDRIALYNFAFLPSKLAHQRVLPEEEMPGPGLKLQMFIEAHNRLTIDGYVFIGMDHYARADDSLSRALEEGTLRRNFMGYNTLRGVDMLAFGTSAISDLHHAFAQNTKKLSVYKRMIMDGQLPVERGLALSKEDRLRRFLIEEVMCNGRLDLDDEPLPGWPVGPVVEKESERLKILEEDGLIRWEGRTLRVTKKGRIFLRNIAVIFDSYVKEASKKPLFSRAV